MKKYICGLILASSFLQAADPKLWTAIDVQQLYKSAQQGNMQQIDNNLTWHRECDTKAPVEMLEKACDMATEKNDASTALVLNARLKQEQMGFWERNFRGIGLVLTGIVLAGIGTYFAWQYKESERQQLRKHEEAEKKKFKISDAPFIPSMRAQSNLDRDDLSADHDDDVSPAHPRPSSPQELAQVYIRPAQQTPAQVTDFNAEDYASWKPESTEQKRN